MDGLTLVFTDYSPLHDIVEESRQEQGSATLALTFGLEGQSGYCGRSDDELCFEAGWSTLTRFGQTAGERRYRAGSRVRQLRLIVDDTGIDRHGLADLVGDVSSADTRLLHRAPLSPALSPALGVLKNAHGPGDEGLLALQIAALNVLAHQVAEVGRTPVSIGFTPDERERLMQAYAFICERYAEPITIPLLSAQFGLNAFKLKTGFRELFQTSPHRLLTETRMRKAHEWLQAGARVSTVAYRTGYQHAGNFSAAFARFYGMTPREVSRDRATVTLPDTGASTPRT